MTTMASAAKKVAKCYEVLGRHLITNLETAEMIVLPIPLATQISYINSVAHLRKVGRTLTVANGIAGQENWKAPLNAGLGYGGRAFRRM